MLPDFPKLKNELGMVLNEHMRIRMFDNNPFLSQPKNVRLFEGGTNSMSRPNEEKDVNDIQSIEAAFEISKAVHEVTLNDILAEMEKASKDLGGQQTRHALDLMSKACDKTGNVVNAKGGKLTAEVMLDMLETIEIAFKDGQPQMPSILGNSKAAENFAIEDRRLASDPALRKRYDDIMNKKLENWNAKEASRKLVG